MNPVADSKPNQVEHIARALYDFFSEKEKAEFLPLLRKVLYQLVTLQIDKGRGFLTKKELDEISDTPNRLHAVGEEHENSPLVFTKTGRLYFRKYFEYEQSIAQFLNSRNEAQNQSLVEQSVPSCQENFRSVLDDYQALAVGIGVHKNWMLLSGGPGTGKTHTLVVLMSLLLKIKPELRIALVAPTGKAAFRLQQSINHTVNNLGFPQELVSQLLSLSQSSTIHRLLGVIPGSVDFRRNKSNPLPHDLVVVDEASMIDLPLMAKLLNALKPTARLILSGDADQLSPVQGGGVFNALVRGSEPNKFNHEDLSSLRDFSQVGEESNALNQLTGHVVTLMKSHRHDSGEAGQNISNLCGLIKEGNGDELVKSVRESGAGVEFISSFSDSRIQEFLKTGFNDFVTSEDPKEALKALAKFRILCAHNHGKYGVEQWNTKSRSLLSFQESDFYPVVIQKNDYGVDLFNGDDGVISGEKAYFENGNGMREIAKARLPACSDAFALSIHRSQGSEYDQVMIVLPPPEAKLLSRELLYVAVSRAKRGVVFVGDPASLVSAVNQEGDLQSGIVELMQ